MAREFKRASRVADAIQRSLGALIPKEIRDPRIGIVNINDVEVSRDLSKAKIYVTFIGLDDDKQCRESTDILNNAASYLRSLVGKELVMRSTPILTFFYDDTAVRGTSLSQLIDKAVASDHVAPNDHVNNDTPGE